MKPILDAGYRILDNGIRTAVIECEAGGIS